MQNIFQNNLTQTPTLTPMANSILNTNLQQTGDFDLSAAVRKVLTMANCFCIDNYDSHSAIMASIGKRPAEQLFYQKEFWIYQLTLLQTLKGISTLEDRVLVNQFNDPKTWFEYFAHNVLDLIQQHDLPIRYGW